MTSRDKGASVDGDVLERAVHDIKNPLAVIGASLEWLQVELGASVKGGASGEVLDALRDAASAARRLGTVADDLLALARLEGANADGPIGAARVDLDAVLVDAARAGHAVAKARGVAVAAPVAVGLSVPGDARLLARAVEAMVDVALRAAEPGTSVGLAARADREDVVVEIGAPVEAAAKAGEARPRPTGGPPPGPSDEELPGAGLGIHLAKRVLEAHGGSLRAELGAREPSAPRLIATVPRRA